MYSYQFTCQTSSAAVGPGRGVSDLPEIGDGVLVPWGLDTVSGEVVDVLSSDHVVVRVPVDDASSEEIDSTTIRVRADALQAMPSWKFVRSRRGRPTPGADAALAWWIDAARPGGDKARV